MQSILLMSRTIATTNRLFNSISLCYKINLKTYSVLKKEFKTIEIPKYRVKSVSVKQNDEAFRIINLLPLNQANLFDKRVFTLNCRHDQIVDNFLSIDPNNLDKYLNRISKFKEVVQQLSFEHLSKVLTKLIEWKISPDCPEQLTIFEDITSVLDRQLADRLNKVIFRHNEELEIYLVFANLFYKLKIKSIFIDSIIIKMSSLEFNLDKTSYLHLMFYLNINSKQKSINRNVLSFLLKPFEELFDEFNLEEIGVICMTLQKNQLPKDLLNRVISKTTEDVSEETNNLIRNSIIKCVTHSIRCHMFSVKFKPQINELFNKLKTLSNNDVMTLSRCLVLNKSVQINDSGFMSDVYQRLYSEPTALRLKDFQMILSTFSHFNVDFDFKHLEMICNQLIRTKELEINKYPNCLFSILKHLCLLKVYPKQLIKQCFDSNYVSKAMKNKDFFIDFLTVYTILSLEMYEDFKPILRTLPKHVYQYLETDVLKDIRSRRMESIKNTICLALESQFEMRVHFCHILPFRRHPLIVISEEYHKFVSFSPTNLKPNMFNNFTVIYTLNTSDYAVLKTMIKGETQMEIRLLEIMGFTVVTIPWDQLTDFNEQIINKIIPKCNQTFN